MLNAIPKPQAVIEDGAVATVAKSPYSVQILLRKDGGQVALTPATREGLVWAKLAPGDVYEVKLSNRSEYDAAVDLTIDGLNLFAFGEGRSEGRVLVRAKDAVVVKGWYRNDEVSNEFKVTKYADSPVASLIPQPHQVGTVTASFAAAWPKDNNPPPDEPNRGDRGETSEESLSTSKGDLVKQQYVEVHLLVGDVRDIVSIRYSRSPQKP